MSHYGELKTRRSGRLGDLYNPSDYPPHLRDLFGISWDFPSVEPPDYLLELSPGLYEQETCPCCRPLRGSGADGRADVHRGVRQAGVSSH